MKKLIAILGILISMLPAWAVDITPGYTFADGQRLTAAQLAALVNAATINAAFYTSKTPGATNLQQSDILLIVSSSSGAFNKILGSAILKNPLLISDQQNYTAASLSPYLYIGIYDPTNNILGKTSLTNLGSFLSQYLNVTNFSLATTNGAKLADWSRPFYTFGVTNHPYFLVWGTNGQPYQQSLSNLVLSAASDLGTNLSLRFTFTQVFAPWDVYGTNASGATNAWYGATVGPITNFNMAQTNTASLVDADTIPVNSTLQGSNTTASLLSIYGYITNKNALPAHTSARLQFNGNYGAFRATNADTTLNCFRPTNYTAGGVTAISFNFNGGAGVISTPAMVSNQVYYITPTNAGAGWYYIYTNYQQAVDNGATNAVDLTSAAAVASGAYMLVITNRTAVNADAIQLVAGSTARDGFYGVYFRTNSTTANYYVSGIVVEGDSSEATVINLANDRMPGTNSFILTTQYQNGSAFVSPLVQVLVNPE